MKVFQDIKPSETYKTLLNRKGQNCFVLEKATCIILFPVQRVITNRHLKQ